MDLTPFEYSILPVFQGLMFLGTGSLWIYLHSFKKKDYTYQDFCPPSFVHAVLSSATSHYCLINYPNYLTDTLILNKPAPIETLILPMISISFSYYDIYISCIYKRTDYLIHGIALFGGIHYAYYTNILPLSNLYSCLETSGIFLNLRPYCKHDAIDYLFVITFIVYRFIFYPTILYYYFSQAPYDSGYIIKLIISGTFFSLNTMWGKVILKKLVKKIKGE